jgi:hypothetical protein
VARLLLPSRILPPLRPPSRWWPGHTSLPILARTQLVRWRRITLSTHPARDTITSIVLQCDTNLVQPHPHSHQPRLLNSDPLLPSLVFVVCLHPILSLMCLRPAADPYLLPTLAAGLLVSLACSSLPTSTGAEDRGCATRSSSCAVAREGVDKWEALMVRWRSVGRCFARGGGGGRMEREKFE